MARIVAHTDFDGLIAAFLAREIFGVEEVYFTEPWLIQKDEVEIKKGDIILDLPYHENCSVWIDHHETSKELLEKVRPEQEVHFDETKPSCPGLMYEIYKEKFPFLEEPLIQEMIQAADKIDSGSFSHEDLEKPDIWGKISITLRSDDKRKDNEYRQLLLNLLSFQDPQKIVEQNIVKNRFQTYEEEQEAAKKELPKLATVHDDILIIDATQTEQTIPRFLPYVMYPQCRISAKISRITDKPELCKVSVGKNIFDQSHPADIGAIMKGFGGGGHKYVGACSTPYENKDIFLQELVKLLRKE